MRSQHVAALQCCTAAAVPLGCSLVCGEEIKIGQCRHYRLTIYSAYTVILVILHRSWNIYVYLGISIISTQLVSVIFKYLQCIYEFLYRAMCGRPLAAAACSGVQPSSSFLLILAPCCVRSRTITRLSSSTA